MNLWRLFASRQGPSLRPWAVAGPVLVLLLAAPLLRPLWAPGRASEREVVILESVRSVLRKHTLALDPRVVPRSDSTYEDANGRRFSAEPPAFTVALSGVAWVIERTGMNIERHTPMVEYALILFAITVPTALSCGFLYRMGRIFELPRGWRITLALACILATGWISYSVVLLPHALAAALVVFATSSLIHMVLAKRPNLAAGWLMAGGFCAALAAVIEPASIWMLVLMPCVVLVLKQPWRARWLGLLLLIAGAAPPLALHASLNPHITGDLLPPRWHAMTFVPATETIIASSASDEAEPLDPSVWLGIGRGLNKLITFTIGGHGIFSHFPILVVAIAGALMVLHRHWTRGLKWMAAGVVTSLLGVLVFRMFNRSDSVDTSFAAPRLLTFLPVLMLWAGAWLRRPHQGLTWTVVGIGFAASVMISILGATAPAPPGGYTGFTAAQAAERLIHPEHFEPKLAVTRR